MERSCSFSPKATPAVTTKTKTTTTTTTTTTQYTPLKSSLQGRQGLEGLRIHTVGAGKEISRVRMRWSTANRLALLLLGFVTALATNAILPHRGRNHHGAHTLSLAWSATPPALSLLSTAITPSPPSDTSGHLVLVLQSTHSAAMASIAASRALAASWSTATGACELRRARVAGFGSTMAVARVVRLPGLRLRALDGGVMRQSIGGTALGVGVGLRKARAVVCAAEAGSVGGAVSPVKRELNSFEKVVDVLTTMFPVWVILGTLIGIYKPAAVTWLQTDLFTLCLGFLMLSMGLTLTFDDFRRCLRNPWTVGVGFVAQYLVKPVLGFAIAHVLKLSAPLATGLILVSCCPGGQASNVATYISKGNVALSVLMTTASTIGAIFMTPLLTKLLAGQLVPVDAVGLAVSTFQVVLMPTIVGVLAHEMFPKIVEKIITVTPLVGVIMTTLLCASPIGQVSDVLVSQGAQLIIPVAILHSAAFLLGYWMSKLFKFGESTSRTISIECGMQSSALGFLLAQKHFSNPLVAVPSAVSVVCMALGGAALAVYWRNQAIPADDKDDFKA